MKEQDSIDNIARSPRQNGSGPDDSPKFGRLLIVLLLAVMLIVAITFLSEAFYS
jgi:hypothetical protein